MVHRVISDGAQLFRVDLPLRQHRFVGVDVDESLLDKDGKLCLDRVKLTAYAHGEYFGLGKKIGTFGFSATKKKKKYPPKTQKGR